MLWVPWKQNSWKEVAFESGAWEKRKALLSLGQIESGFTVCWSGNHVSKVKDASFKMLLSRKLLLGHWQKHVEGCIVAAVLWFEESSWSHTCQSYNFEQVADPPFCFVLFYFEMGGGLTMYPLLSRSLICWPDWPWTNRDPIQGVFQLTKIFICDAAEACLEP